MFNSYYEFNSHDAPCWFNAEKEKAEKDLSLIHIQMFIRDRDIVLQRRTIEKCAIDAKIPLPILLNRGILLDIN